MFLKIVFILLFFISCSKTENTKKQLNRNIAKDSILSDSLQPKAKEIRPKVHPDAPKGVFIKSPTSKIILADINTSVGKMTFELYPNRAPLATENFINLSKKGFYNGNEFFRLVQDFIVQTGDKTNTGYADAGYYFKTERHMDLSHDRKGILSYANHDKESNSSQFFITLSAQTQLDERHPVFGMLLKGHDVLEKINNQDVDDKNRPINTIKILSIKIIEN